MPVDLDTVRQAAPKKTKASSKDSAADAEAQALIDEQTQEIADIVWGANAQPQAPLSAKDQLEARPPWLLRGPRGNPTSDTTSIEAVSDALGVAHASAVQFDELSDEEELGGDDASVDDNVVHDEQRQMHCFQARLRDCALRLQKPCPAPVF